MCAWDLRLLKSKEFKPKTLIQSYKYETVWNINYKSFIHFPACDLISSSCTCPVPFANLQKFLSIAKQWDSQMALGKIESPRHWELFTRLQDLWNLTEILLDLLPSIIETQSLEFPGTKHHLGTSQAIFYFQEILLAKVDFSTKLLQANILFLMAND